MAALDRIRLTGLLRKDPAQAGSFYWVRRLPAGALPAGLALPAGVRCQRGAFAERAVRAWPMAMKLPYT